MLLRRIITSSVLIVISVVTLFFDTLSGFVITCLIAACLWEYFAMLEKKGIGVYKYVGTALGVILPLSIAFRFELTRGWELLFTTLGILALTLIQFKRRSNSGAVVELATTIFGILYISWFLSFLIKIRYLPGGFGLLASLLMMTKLGDIGAYCIGSRYGKTPLMPLVSPKKTVEGAIGGLLFSMLGAVVCRPFLGGSIVHLAAMGVAFGALAQLGDLSESLMKRDCEVKDSSQVLPGMGGVLDVMDSLLFTAPAFYFYINFIAV